MTNDKWPRRWFEQDLAEIDDMIISATEDLHKAQGLSPCSNEVLKYIDTLQEKIDELKELRQGILDHYREQNGEDFV